MTFDECRDAYIAVHRAGWRNVKHAKQWTATLTTYATPVFGHLPVAAIDTDLVMKVLAPIWNEKTETASRLRGRIEAILDWAKTSGFRTGDNPARWDGHLQNKLPKKSKVRKVRNQPALPYAQMGAFMDDLRKRAGIAAKALQFTILTAARSDEVISMRWHEIDMAEKLWTVPPGRMKGGREHCVPLSDQAAAIIREMRSDGKDIGQKYIFPGAKPGRPLSNVRMTEVIRRMNAEREAMVQPRWTDPKQNNRDVVPHGFRSSFKDWATDWTPSPAEIVDAAKRGEIVEAFPRDLVEVALAHRLNSKTEEAYRRTTMIEKRRRLMGKWAEYCNKPATGGQVVPLRKDLDTAEQAAARQMR
jgi:integrase